MRWKHPGGVLVERARGRDALPILALHREVLEERQYFITRPEELTVTVDEVGRAIAATRDSGEHVWLVARLAKVRVAGFLTLRGGPLARMRHAAKLEIMVARGCRGQGVGRALMTSALEWATQSPVIEKVGLSVFATNARAIELYRSMGFEEEGRRRREYRMEDGSFRDDVLMYRFV